MIRSFGCTSSLSFSSSRFSLWALQQAGEQASGRDEGGAVAQGAGLQAQSPTARCVLPTPGGPSSSTLSASAMKRQVASSWITFGSSDG